VNAQEAWRRWGDFSSTLDPEEGSAGMLEGKTRATSAEKETLENKARESATE
jgi:hypothetical protein